MTIRASVRVIALTVMALPLVGTMGACGELGGVNTGGLGGLACPELGAGAASASFAADARANATIRAFVQASSDLMQVSGRVEADVAAACTRMAQDLGVPPSPPAVGRPGGRAEGACQAVAARMDAILAAGASAKVNASYTPPECKVEGSAYASCAGQCNVSVDPGYVVAHCDPGQLSGQCEGTCQGSCEGTCNGACNGNCSAKNAAGQCAGKCDGTCSGQCTATCHARCEGTWKAPRCATEVKAPSVDAKCDASCKAHADLTAQCTEPKVTVQSSINVGDMPKLIATLQANLPTLLRAQIGYGERIAGDVQTLVQIGSELPGVLGDAGAHAAACVAAAANGVAQAQASLRVSVQVSAQVSGKVTAKGG
jgi:hypothetical protein